MLPFPLSHESKAIVLSDNDEHYRAPARRAPSVFRATQAAVEGVFGAELARP
jgi:hypothetical protein